LVNQSKPTVAIYGGSFDPPHLGHQHIVEHANKSLDCNILFVVPAYLNPFKTSMLASPSQRLEWCHILFDSLPNVEVKSYEIKEGKSTTTSQSVKYFNIAYHVKYIVIGSDNLPTLTAWDNYTWLNENITWVVVTRNGYPLALDALRSYKILKVDIDISSSSIRTKNDLDYVDTKIKKSVQTVLQGKS